MKRFISIVLALAMMASMSSMALAIDNPFDNVNAVPISGAENAVGSILGFVQWVGYAIAVGMLIYIGIKYMMASANEKADLKAGSVKYVIGAIIVAAAATICGWIVSFGDGL